MAQSIKIVRPFLRLNHQVCACVCEAFVRGAALLSYSNNNIQHVFVKDHFFPYYFNTLQMYFTSFPRLSTVFF